MNSTDRILEQQIGTRSAASSRGGGHANAADFRAALAEADSAVGPAAAPAVATGRSSHVVKAGETLYGIANARLAAAGQRATPGASMRYALQIARENQIRNPDRILAGQQLDLAPAAATINVGNEAATAGAGSIDLAGNAGTRAFHKLDWQHRIAETYRAEDAGGSDGAGSLLPNPVLPTVGSMATDDDIRSYPEGIAAARVDLALYRQTSPAAAPKPSGELPDIVYKGVVGKALDLMPLEPSTRTGLQQANAVISNSVAGRSLAALTGLGGPLLTIAGLVWGLFSAHKISATPSDAPKQMAQTTTTEIVR